MSTSERQEWLSSIADYSRTLRTGEVDVTVSPVKAELVTDSEDPQRGLFRAVDYLETVSLVKINSVSVLRGVADSTNELVTGCAPRLRSWNSIYPPYLASSRILSDRLAFSSELLECIRGGNVASALTLIVWHIDLHGHYYVDGCGRTAAVLGLSLARQFGCRLIGLSREDVVSTAYQRQPVRALRAYFEAILKIHHALPDESRPVELAE